jgi:hypothetical protein
MAYTDTQERKIRYETNKDKEKEQMRKWQNEHKEQQKEYRKKHYLDNKEEMNLKTKIRHKSNPEKYKEIGKRCRESLKEKFLEIYGGKCNCLGCNETNHSFLTLDHVKNDGYMRRNGGRNETEYRKAIENYSPEIYQVLCYKCNCGKGRNHGICPHIEIVKNDVKSPRLKKYYNEVRMKFLELYGEECSCCGETMELFLTMSHLGIRPKNAPTDKEYRRAVKEYKPNEFTTECYNCNLGRQRNKGICPHINTGEK